MTLDTSIPEVRFALDAVRQAGRLAQQVQAEMVTPRLTKEDRSPVTVADFSVQALVAAILAESFPKDSLLAEETSDVLRRPEASQALNATVSFVSRYLPNVTPQAVSDWIDRGSSTAVYRFWTLDPIDGTKGFLRGGQYAIALALVVDGNVRIGVLGCPNLSEAGAPAVNGSGLLVVAVRGQGSWVVPLRDPDNLVRLHVSACHDLKDARMLRSFESDHTNSHQLDELARSQEMKLAPLLMDSQAKYAVLAAGRADLLLRLLSPSDLHYRERIWDQAAGSIVLEEAGGRITDLDGKNLDFNAGRTLAHNRGILASNGALHAPALEALKQIPL